MSEKVSEDVRKRADDLVRAVLAVNLTKSRVRMAAREIAAAEERGRRRGEAERDELRDALTQLLAWADHVAARAGVRMNDPNTGARELSHAALASDARRVGFKDGSYFDSQQKKIEPCKHGEWPMACWECQSEYELAKTPEQRAQEHKLRAALAPREDHDCGKQPGECEATCK